jgi:AhpD family alkylhydroperoxidase
MSRLPYPKLAPKPYAHMIALGHYINTETNLEHNLVEFVNLRASTLNGCGFCIGMHTAELQQHNEPQSRIDAIAHWHESDAFTPRERAALAWTDALTNIQNGHASDADYVAVNEFFTGKDLVDLTWVIAKINAWNRMGVGFAAEWNPPQQKSEEPKEVAAVDDDGGKVAED